MGDGEGDARSRRAQTRPSPQQPHPVRPAARDPRRRGLGLLTASLVAAFVGVGGETLASERASVTAVPVAAESALRGRDLADRLRQPFSMTTPATDLIGVVQRVQRVEPIAVWIDPRVDPRSRVEASDRTTPLAAFLDDLAAQSQSRRRSLGATIALVPALADDRLLTLARLREQEWSDRIDAPLLRRDVVWTEPRSPAEILGLIEATFPEAIAFERPPKVAADLWRPGLWLGVSPCEALAAALVPMDRGFEWTDDGRVRLTDLAERYDYETTYPTAIAEAAAARFGDRAARVGRRVRFRGTAAEHEELVALRDEDGERAAPVDWSRQRFTLTLRARVAQVLELVEDRGIPIAFDRERLAEAGVDLRRPIALELDKASVAEFAAALADAIGVRSEGDAASARLIAEPADE